MRFSCVSATVTGFVLTRSTSFFGSYVKLPHWPASLLKIIVHSSLPGMVCRLYVPALSGWPLTSTSSVTMNCVASFAPARDGLLGDGDGLLLPVHVEEQIRLRAKVLEGLLDLDGLVNPLQSVLELVVVEVGFADGERHLPIAGVGRDRRVNLRAHERVNVRHLDRERHGQLLPAQDDLRGVRRHLRYLVREPLLRLRRQRGLHLDPERVLLRVVLVAAPLIRLLVEDDSPLFTARYGVEAVSAGG